MSLPKPLTQLIGGLYLASLLFGLATWVMLPFQLFEVYDTRKNGKLVKVNIVASYMYYQSRNCSLRLTFITPEAKEVTIGDALPGDIATCGRNERIAAQFNKGTSHEFLFTGKKYYIAHGEYWWSLLIAAIGFLPYIYLIHSIRKSKAAKEASN